MGHYGRHDNQGGFFEQPGNDYQREKLVSFIRRNRKKILLALAGVALTVLIFGILIVYLIFSLLLKSKDVVLNPNTINQVQKIATESGKLIPQNLPQNLPQNEWLQNFQWIINIINTLQNLGG